MNSWILLLYGLPTKQNAGRVQLWRKLRKFGALQLKTSAYVLPDEPVHHERFQWLATQIRDDGGEATLIRVSEIEGMPHDKIVQLFNDARGKEYTQLVTELSDFVRSNRKKISNAYSDDLEKFQVRFKELQETDYFKCPKGQDAQMLLRDAEGLGRARKSGSAPRLQKKYYLRRKWLTRPKPEGDRVASAWLIRKFIDPEASFVFAASAKQHRDAIPYDMFDAEFSHHGDDCTFETLVKRFRIDDAAVAQIAEMIHDADLEDGKFKRYEGIGIDRVLKGWAKQGRSDDEILTKGMELIDALYATMKR